MTVIRELNWLEKFLRDHDTKVAVKIVGVHCWYK